MPNVEDLAGLVMDIGLADVWLPFALVLIVVMVGLSRVAYLNKRMRVVIAISAAAMTVYVHVAGLASRCWDPVIIINEAVPVIGYAAIGVIVFFAVAGLIGLHVGVISMIMRVGVLVMIAVVGYAAVSSGGPDCLPYDLMSLPFIEFLFAFVIFVVGAMWMLGSGSMPGRDRDLY